MVSSGGRPARSRGAPGPEPHPQRLRLQGGACAQARAQLARPLSPRSQCCPHSASPPTHPVSQGGRPAHALSFPIRLNSLLLTDWSLLRALRLAPEAGGLFTTSTWSTEHRARSGDGAESADRVHVASAQALPLRRGPFCLNVEGGLRRFFSRPLGLLYSISP